MVAISIVNAKKNYGSLWALKGINLEVNKGEFFGLLGPNGAGKTTLIHSMVGLCRLTEGSIHVHGYDVVKDFLKTRALIGFAPQDINLDRFFPIRRILMYHAGFFGIPRKNRVEIVDGLLTQFHLQEKSHQSYYRLSGGMQKRLLIAKAMVSKPEVLILDEPTAGIDVEQRHELWGYLRKLNEQGTTIILTTHYIDEAEALCRRIGIIHQGEIRELGKPQDLIEKYCEKKVTIKMSKPIQEFEMMAKGLPFEIKENIVIGRGAAVGPLIEAFNHLISKDPQCRILDMHVERGTLEDVFLKVTGSQI